MIKCMIVEDEILAQQVIQNHIKHTPQLELVAVCGNVIEANEALNTKEIDLIFLDIQLPGMTGMHFLRTLTESPLVILTTAYAEHALESYEFNVIDYLLKPISLDRFTRAINKLTSGRLVTVPPQEPEQPYDHIFIRSGSKFFKVNFSEIMLVESMKDYLKIHTPEHKLLTLQTMNEIEKVLPPKQFIRVHKSFIVAVQHIRSIYGNTIEAGSHSIPIGNSYKSNVMNLLSM